MSEERVYQAILIHLEQEMDGFLGAAFVETNSGRPLAVHSVQRALDQRALTSAARSSLIAHVLVDSSTEGSVVEEIVVTTNEHIRLCQPISPSIFLSLVADRRDTNLGLVKAAARSCIERLLPPQRPSAPELVAKAVGQ